MGGGAGEVVKYYDKMTPLTVMPDECMNSVVNVEGVQLRFKWLQQLCE